MTEAIELFQKEMETILGDYFVDDAPSAELRVAFEALKGKLQPSQMDLKYWSLANGYALVKINSNAEANKLKAYVNDVLKTEIII